MIQMTGDSFTLDVDTTQLNDGDHTLSVEAIALNGRTSRVDLFTIPVINGPTIVANAPLEDATVSRVVDLNLTIFDLNMDSPSLGDHRLGHLPIRRTWSRWSRNIWRKPRCA